MSVRPATLADKRALRPLYLAFEEELGGPDFFREPWQTAWQGLREYIEDGLAFVAEEEGRLLGFAFAFVAHAHPKLGEVSDLYVVPAARRRGLADALLTALMREFERRGLEHVGLEVLLANDQARAYYARLGFEQLVLYLVARRAELAERLREAERGRRGTD